MRKGLALSIAASIALAVAAIASWAASLWGFWIGFSKLFGLEELYVALCVAIYTLVDPLVGALAISSILLAVSSNVALKLALKLPRPPRQLWRVEARGPGFPSGHSEVCASFWTSVSKGFRSVAIAIIGAAISVIVAVSRVLLGVHYPIDVVGGLALGIAAGLIPYALSSRLGPRISVATCCAISAALSAYALASSSGYPWLSFVARSSLGISMGFSAFAAVGEKVIELHRAAGLGRRVALFASSIIVCGGLVATSKVVGYPTLLGFGAGLWLALAPLAIARSGRKG